MALYRKTGFLIVHGVLSAAECGAINRAAERLPTALDGSYHIATNPHLTDPVFRGMIGRPAIVQIMERLLHGRVSTLQMQYFFTPPGAEGYSLHQDNFYVQSHADAFASAWGALESCGPENGGLYVFPGSHKEGLLPVDECNRGLTPAGRDINVVRSPARLMEEEYDRLDVELPPGSVIFLHALLAHGSYGNRTADRFRRSFVITYIRQGAPFRSGRDNKRMETDCYNIPELRVADDTQNQS